MTSPNRQDNLIAAAARACQKPVLVALAAQAQSPKKAAELAERNAERLGLSKQDIQDTRWLAILKRDAEALLGPGVDFLAALQQVSQPATQQRSTGMKTVWSTGHYVKKNVIPWLKKIMNNYSGFVPYVSSGNEQFIDIVVHSASGDPGSILLRARGTLIDSCDRLQPITITIYRPQFLDVAKVIAKRWERRIPLTQRTKDSVVIVRDY